jgi:heptosyltransferase-2
MKSSQTIRDERGRETAAAAAPRILIIRAGAIGDTLMATPLVRALRRTFPGAYLVFLCSHWAHDVLRHNPHLDEVIPLRYRNLPAWLSLEKRRALHRLRGLNLDCTLNLETHPRFLDLVRRTGSARTISYASLPGTAGFERAAFDPKLHSIESNLRLAGLLGVRPDGHQMELHYPQALDALVAQRLAAAGIGAKDFLVGVHAGWGGRRLPHNQTRLKSWPADRFAHIIRWLMQRVGARVVLTGSSTDRPLNEFIAGLSGVSCVNLAGELSILETAALIHRMNLYLTVDSGPAHMTTALGTPLITLWGPAIFEQTAPSAGLGPVRILYHRVHCAPCYGTPLMKTCQDNICMKEIEVFEVQKAVEQMLSGRPPEKQGSLLRIRVD